MAISRMQQPRQMYGLGSLVKSVKKSVKSAVSGAADAVKSVAKSDLGKAAILGAGLYGLGGAKFLGGKGIFAGGQGLSRFANLANLPGAIGGALGLGVPEGGKPTFGQFATVFGLGSLGGAALEALTASGASEEELQDIRDVDSLRSYLRKGYEQLNPGASPMQVDRFVEANTTEYRANGGRIGYQDGTPKEGIETLTPMQKPDGDVQYVTDMIKSLDGFAQLIAQEGNLDRQTFQNHMDLFEDFRQRKDIDPMPAYTYLKRRVEELNPEVAKMIYITQEDNPDRKTIERPEKAYGGRMGYALGDRAENNAMQASGIMNLPLNENPAGVTELDLRETGGFIPPVGVKEKADDIPAMLSNNEFVFTADAVRGMGDGDVNKGAQRMYDMMKKLENGGRV